MIVASYTIGCRKLTSDNVEELMPALVRERIQAIVAEHKTPMRSADLIAQILERRIYDTRQKALNYVGWLVRNGYLASCTADGTATTSVAGECLISVESTRLREECACDDGKSHKAPCHNPMNRDMAAILAWLAERENVRHMIAEELIPERERLKAALAEVERKIDELHQKLQKPEDVAAESGLRHVINSQRPVLENAGVL